jgi:hypothetical protein
LGCGVWGLGLGVWGFEEGWSERWGRIGDGYRDTSLIRKRFPP